MHCFDVDAMLDTMTALQFREWLAFFKIRADLREADARPELSGPPPDAKELQTRLVQAFSGYKERRNRSKAQPEREGE